jgi:hypothetical protein
VVQQIRNWNEEFSRDFKVILSHSEDKVTVHAMKACGEAEIKLQSLLTSPIDNESGQLHSLDTTTAE